jgi:hypothetical protein
MKNLNPLWKIFANLRGAAIIGVLVNHAFILYRTYALNVAGTLSVGLGGTQLDFNNPVVSIGLQLPGYCVPLFLFLAGYSAALSKNTWLAIGQRIKSLLFPYLVWSFFAWGWFAFWAWYGKTPQFSWPVTDFLARLVTGNTQAGYFFFILIFEWYALSRWVVPFVKVRPRTALLVAGAIMVASAIFNYISVTGFPLHLGAGGYREWNQVWIIPRWVPLLYAAYPVLGMYAAFNDQPIKKILDVRWPYFVAALVVSALALVAESGYLYHLLSFLGYSPQTATHFSIADWRLSYHLWSLVAVFAFAALFRRRIPGSKLYAWINKNAFILFLLNGPCVLLLDRVIRLLKKAGLVDGFHTYAWVLLIFAFEFLAPAAFCFLVNKLVPRARKVLLG